MKLLKALGAVIVGAASILGGFGTFAQWAGIEFGVAAGDRIVVDGMQKIGEGSKVVWR